MSADHPSVPYGFCHCGCGEQTNRARYNDVSCGRVKGEPFRFVHGHHMRVNHPQRTNAGPRYIVDPQTGCWTWQLSLNSTGRPWATREIYEAHRGPLAPGLELHHRCPNPLCVNPDHLDALTRVDHMRRHGKACMTPELAAQIRTAIGGGMSQRGASRHFGISAKSIRRILT